VTSGCGSVDALEEIACSRAGHRKKVPRVGGEAPCRPCVWWFPQRPVSTERSFLPSWPRTRASNGRNEARKHAVALGGEGLQGARILGRPLGHSTAREVIAGVWKQGGCRTRPGSGLGTIAWRCVATWFGPREQLNLGPSSVATGRSQMPSSQPRVSCRWA